MSKLLYHYAWSDNSQFVCDVEPQIMVMKTPRFRWQDIPKVLGVWRVKQLSQPKC